MDLEAFARARRQEAATTTAALLADADAAVASALEEARRTAEAIVAEARADGAAAADRELELALARGRRSARGIVLAARREAYEHLREEALAAAFRCRGTPGYAELLDRLEGRARRQLGDAARIERDPPDRGGVIAESQGRRVDQSLASLVDGSIRELGEEVERLWT